MLAWDHALCRAVSGVFVRAVLGSLRRRARQAGVPDGRGGAVAIIQRFGAALNLNVHVHALVLDGVYVEDGGSVRFHEVLPPTDDDMDRLLGTIDRRVNRLLARRGVLDDVHEGSAADSWRDEAPVLAGIAGASVQGRRALGERAGAALRRCGASADLLALAPSGRGAALTPRPRINLLLYYGVLGARSAWRSRLKARDPDTTVPGGQCMTDATSSSRTTPIPSRTNRLWAELMQRSFGFDVLACPRCGNRLELIALIEDPQVIRRILSHLGMPTEVPTPRPARSPPPLQIGRSDPWYDQDGSVP